MSNAHRNTKARKCCSILAYVVLLSMALIATIQIAYLALYVDRSHVSYDDSTLSYLLGDTESTNSKSKVVAFPDLGPNMNVLNIKVPSLQPLRTIDREKYTLRINAWRRPEMLVNNVAYFSTCEGVAEIQIVWCDTENEPPLELYNKTTFGTVNVVVDKREKNSLNERFNLSKGSPTLGIINMDDDDLFPCIALDNVFFKWTYNPERLVATQPRKHIPNSYNYCGWARRNDVRGLYGTNVEYTMALPTIAGVVHRDYLNWYTTYFPRTEYHNFQFNCEDIALSFFITALTEGKPPLLGDYWALNSQTQSNKVSNKLSVKRHHVGERTNCTRSILRALSLDRLPHHHLASPFIDVPKFEATFVDKRKPTEEEYFPLNFEIGAPGKTAERDTELVPRHVRMMKVVNAWKTSPALYANDTKVLNGKRHQLFNKVY